MSSRQMISDHLIQGENVNFLGGDGDLNFPVFQLCVYKAWKQIKIKL